MEGFFSSLAGNAITVSGTGVRSIAAFDWATQAILNKKAAAANGDWSMGLPRARKVGLTYLSDGFAPVTHGPYTTPPAVDADYAKVISLLYLNGSFSDTTGMIWASNGAALWGDGPFEGVGRVENPDGNPGWFMEAPASTKWAFGLNDFTVECFINLALMPSGYYYSPMGNWSSSGGWCFFVRPNGFLSFHNVGTVAVSAADSIKLKKWQHIAYSRKGSIGRLFIGGRLVAVIDDTVNVTAQSGLRLLGNQTSSDFWRGSVAMPRVTAGVGRYVSDFTQFVEAFPTDVS